AEAGLGRALEIVDQHLGHGGSRDEAVDLDADVSVGAAQRRGVGGGVGEGRLRCDEGLERAERVLGRELVAGFALAAAGAGQRHGENDSAAHHFAPPAALAGTSTKRTPADSIGRTLAARAPALPRTASMASPASRPPATRTWWTEKSTSGTG